MADVNAKKKAGIAFIPKPGSNQAQAKPRERPQQISQDGL
jgi:hypothetical protein